LAVSKRGRGKEFNFSKRFRVNPFALKLAVIQIATPS